MSDVEISLGSVITMIMTHNKIGMVSDVAYLVDHKQTNIYMLHDCMVKFLNCDIPKLYYS